MITDEIKTFRILHESNVKHNTYAETFEIMTQIKPLKYKGKNAAMCIICSLLDVRDLLIKISSVEKNG